MPITSNTSSSTILAHEYGPRAHPNTISSKFILSAPPPSRKRHQPKPIPNLQINRNANSPACSPRPSPYRRRSSSARPLSPRSPFSSFLSFVDTPSTAARATPKNSAYAIGAGVPGALLSPIALDTIRLFASGNPRRRSVSGPAKAWSFETHFEPSLEPTDVSAISGLNPSSPVATPVHVLFQRARSLSALKAKTPASSSSPTKPKSKSKARPTPIMASTKNGHVNVLLLPKPRDKEGAPSIRSNTSASTSTSKSKSRKTPELQSRQGSTSSSKTPRPAPNPALRAQRSLTPARAVAHDAFRPLPYATHAALDEFFGDPRKMNALHAHESTSNQLGARPGEVGYGASVAHMGADGWIWFDALEEQEYAWLMAEAGTPVAPEVARNERKEKKKPKMRSFLKGRRGSTASESSGRSGWESFDPLRRGSESGTSDGGIVDPTTYDLDPTRPPRYRAAVLDGSARYKTATLDASAWDATVQPRGRQAVGGASTPKSRRGRSRRGSASRGNRSVERRRPPPLNLDAVSNALSSLGPPAPAPAPARRPSLPAPRLPPSLADAARADFVSSSYQPHPSKRDLNLDPETPWSANLPQETIFRSMGPATTTASPAPASPFKAMFARRGSLTPLPLKHTPMPLPPANPIYEFKGAGPNGALPKLPPMPMENGIVAPEGRRKTSLADIFRRGFSGKGSRK